MIVIAAIPKVRDAALAAVQRVEAFEPKHPGGPARPLPPLNGADSFQTIFRQMAALPATVLSVSFPQADGELATVIFLRSAFTISQFRREMSRPL